MKNYEITVDGKKYAVSVEEVSGSVGTATLPPKNDASSKEGSQSKPMKTAPVASGVEITAPMPGTIINVMVQAGESVRTGQVVCMLEAMKMENEIVAPEDGTVSEVPISKGTQVEAGEILVRL